jgi:alanine racemase
MAADKAGTGATLTIDLGALTRNYRIIAGLSPRARIGAVVKADGYGLGMAEVASALAQAGCDSFFVATPEEGMALREALSAFPAARIFVLHGFCGVLGGAFLSHALVPVLNTHEDIEIWYATARKAGQPLPTVLHVDTGMNRLGLPSAEAQALASDRDRRSSFAIELIMSHLACAEEPDNPLNEEQRNRFERVRRAFGHASGSLANSAGILLGAPYQLDLVRPGIALYGGNPRPDERNRFETVARIEAPILQVRHVDRGESVGYGATHRAQGPARLATVGVGYADGYLRALSNCGQAAIAGRAAPVVGRVSMDLLTLDVSAVPEAEAGAGTMVELMGPHATVDDLARTAGTIPYELLTRLGPRLRRRYLEPTSGV